MVWRTSEPDRGLARALAWPVLVLGVLVLAGWATQTPRLVTFSPELPAMKANTALCLVLLAVGVLRPAWARPAAALVFVISAVTVAEWVGDRRLGIDELLLEDFLADVGAPPGRMAVATAVSLASLALALWAPERRHWAQAWPLVAFAVGYVAVLGYAYDVSTLYAVTTYSTVALTTGLALMLASLALLAQVPGGVLSWLRHGGGLGAVAARRLVPLSLVGFPLLGGLRLAGEELGWYDGRFGLALMVMLAATGTLTLTLVIARRLELVDQLRQQALSELMNLNASLREGRDAAWQDALDLRHGLEEEQARFLRAITQVDDHVRTLEVLPDGGTSVVFASPDPQGRFGVLDPPSGHGEVAPGLARVREEDVPALRQALRHIEVGKPVNSEVRYRGDDGVARWLWLRGTPRREGGRLFFDAVVTDVSERHALLDKLSLLLASEREQRLHLEAVDRMKDEFLAVAGHELRTPLAVIRGNLDLVEASDDPVEWRRRLSTIDRRTTGLQELVADLFDLAQLRTGQLRIEPRTTRLDHAVQDVVDELAPEVSDAVSVQARLDAVAVWCDPLRLHQIVANLVGNAVKYTPPGGSVDVEVALDGDGHGVSGDGRGVLIVRDTGIGVDEADLPHLFDRFFRSESAQHHGIPGTGLGLSITHALVTAQGGTISARQRDGGGLEMRVDLPLRPAP